MEIFPMLFITRMRIFHVLNESIPDQN